MLSKSLSNLYSFCGEFKCFSQRCAVTVSRNQLWFPVKLFWARTSLFASRSELVNGLQLKWVAGFCYAFVSFAIWCLSYATEMAARVEQRCDRASAIAPNFTRTSRKNARKMQPFGRSLEPCLYCVRTFSWQEAKWEKERGMGSGTRTRTRDAWSITALYVGTLPMRLSAPTKM